MKHKKRVLKNSKKIYLSYTGLFSLLLLVFVFFVVFASLTGFFVLSDAYSNNEFYEYKVYPKIKTIVFKGVNWILLNQEEDGNILYSFNHLTGEEKSVAKSVREIGGIYGLNYFAKRFPTPTALNGALKGLEYLKKNIEVREGVGYFSVKHPSLGHAGIALLSFLESPYSHRYAREINALTNFIFLMQKSDGSFYTAYPGITSPRQVNYFPGEALLALIVFYEKTNSKAALKAIEKAFPYYRNYFEENPNTAFYSWHAQAFSKAYLATGKKEYKEFVFRLSDWITENHFDKLNKERYKGKKYSVITTAVYSEGLAEAYRIAIISRDRKRAEKYKKALLKALKNIENLQSTHYPEKKEYGGFFFTSFDPIVRIDNTQHAIIALIKMLEYNVGQ